MEQRLLGPRRVLGVLDQERRRGHQRRDLRVAQRSRRETFCLRALRPDRRQMGLARARRPNEQKHAVWPVGPALDHLERSAVRGTDEKVRAPVTRDRRQIERQLTRPVVHG